MLRQGGGGVLIERDPAIPEGVKSRYEYRHAWLLVGANLVLWGRRAQTIRGGDERPLHGSGSHRRLGDTNLLCRNFFGALLDVLTYCFGLVCAFFAAHSVAK